MCLWSLNLKIAVYSCCRVGRQSSRVFSTLKYRGKNISTEWAEAQNGVSMLFFQGITTSLPCSRNYLQVIYHMEAVIFYTLYTFMDDKCKVLRNDLTKDSAVQMLHSPLRWCISYRKQTLNLCDQIFPSGIWIRS